MYSNNIHLKTGRGFNKRLNLTKQSFDLKLVTIVTKCKRTHKFDQWKNMTSNNQNIKNAVEYFKNCPTDELLALEKDRHVFNFNTWMEVPAEILTCP